MTTFDPNFLPHLIEQGTPESILLLNSTVLKTERARDGIDAGRRLVPGLDGAVIVELVESRRRKLQSLGDRNVASLGVFNFKIHLQHEHDFAPPSVRRFDEWRREEMDIMVSSVMRPQIVNSV